MLAGEVVIMEFIFFDKDDRQMFRRSDAIDAHVIHEEYKHTASFPYDSQKVISHGMRVGWLDANGQLALYEIRQPSSTEPSGVQSYEAEHVAVAELTDYIIEDKRAFGVTASTALSRALEGSAWTVGTVEVNPTGSGNFYYTSAWQACQDIRKAWGIELVPRLTFSGTMITGRYVDIRARRGAYRGVRLTLERNIETAGITYDDRSLVTALYGRGKGEVVGSTAEGADTYGRKITFADVVWTKAGGDPADKPAGQKYVEDTAATAAFGRNGRPRYGVVDFDDCENPEELLALTWAELQKRIVPKVTIDLTVTDLRAIGYAKEGIELGDDVDVIINPWRLQIRASVVQLDEDMIDPESTRPVIGDYRSNIVYKDMTTSTNAQVGQQIAQIAPSLLQGYIDTAVLGIMSSKTHRDTLPDGSEIYVTEDETKAVRFAGGGVLLASGKNAAGDWEWRTAITGQGIVADEITTGTLNANLIHVLGTGTYFDGTTLRIQHPSLGANTYSEIDANGLRMIADGEVVGGLYKDDSGNVVSATGTLFNPNSKAFSAQIGNQTSVGLVGYGIDMKYNGVVGGNIGVYTQEETPDAPPAGMAMTTNGAAAIDGESVSIVAKGDGGIHIISAGEIVFTFVGQNAGTTETLSFTAQDIWDMLAKD